MELNEQQQKDLENLKLVQYALADVHFKLTTRIQYLPEEFEQAMKSIGVIMSFHQDVTKKVHELEPPKEETKEPQKPYVMDLTHVKVEDDSNGQKAE